MALFTNLYTDKQETLEWLETDEDAKPCLHLLKMNYPTKLYKLVFDNSMQKIIICIELSK